MAGAAALGATAAAGAGSWLGRGASAGAAPFPPTASATGLLAEVPDPSLWFLDVPPTHPFFPEISWVAGEGVAQGYGDRTFRPGLPVSRQAMAAFLHRLAGAPVGPFPAAGFRDVGVGHPFRHEIAWLVDQGIATGFPDGRFEPTAPISRQAVAAFLQRVQGAPSGPFPDPRFSDVGPSHPFRSAIHWMARSGITTGFTDGTFRPESPVTRQAMAAFLLRLVEVQDDEVQPFRHGVASGDPLPDGVVLWTRVTPEPQAGPGSGRGPDTEVRWEVATSSALDGIVASGTFTATAAHDHTVKLDVRGLEPSTTYWYRFSFDGVTSPLGRTRTAPAADSSPERLRIGVVSCANLESGSFSAYRHLADRDDLDLVLHLGDYLYEYENSAHGARIHRQHEPPHELRTLADYRQRHAQYKRDADLRTLHARHPVVAVLDDHEVANDAWRDGAQNHTTPGEGPYLARRAAAYQAYLEYLPIREAQPGTVERRLQLGQLADLHLLDLRRYRDVQVVAPTDVGEIEDPARTITGAAQMAWLKDGLAAAGSPQWRLIGTSVLATPISSPAITGTMSRALGHLAGGRLPVAGFPYNVDQWDGYAADRAELLDHLVDEGVQDVVFLAGDLHCSWACDVPREPDAYRLGLPGGEAVATELAVPSVTSDNLDDIAGRPPRTSSLAVEAAFKHANPHVKLLEMDSHGYAVLEVTAEQVRMDWWYVADRDDPTAGQAHGQAWRVEAGSRRVTPVS